MTQPQQPFGEARCDLCARGLCTGRCDISDALLSLAPQRQTRSLEGCSTFYAPPLRETAEPVDAAAHERRIAALEDECRRLRAEVERIGKAQAV